MFNTVKCYLTKRDIKVFKTVHGLLCNPVLPLRGVDAPAKNYAFCVHYNENMIFLTGNHFSGGKSSNQSYTFLINLCGLDDLQKLRWTRCFFLGDPCSKPEILRSTAKTCDDLHVFWVQLVLSQGVGLWQTLYVSNQRQLRAPWSQKINRFSVPWGRLPPASDKNGHDLCTNKIMQ